jgi:GTPase SAR1 family protein
MSQPSTPPAALQLDSAAVRIVLFGLPGAGKSSLLGALAQAAETQPQVLSGRLIDPTQGLAELRRRLYDNQPQETLQEIVPYPVRLDPPAGDTSALRNPVSAVLIDCDGRAANELLTQPDELAEDNGLARAILQADTLILVVDAAADAARLERDFGHFAQFLSLLERSRAQRNDVGGLPVYLVLTKCDLLAQKTDTPADWIDRIEERKRQVGQRFQDFLGRQTDHVPLPFGSIDLHLWATATGRPALPDAPARPREPYGVAELFRQCLESAATFDVRETRAGQRLQWTVLGSLGFLALLVVLAVVVWLTRSEDAINPLERRIDDYRLTAQQQTPAEKARSAQANLDKLTAFMNKDPDAFKDLPASKQEYVRQEAAKLKAFLKAYQAYVAKLKTIMPPQEATNKQQLQKIEDSLDQLEAPPAYRAEWASTDAGKIVAEWQTDIDILRRTVDEAEKWYRSLYRRARDIDEHRKDKGFPLFEKASDLWQQAKSPPFPENEPQQLLPGASGVTYGTVYHFNTVQDARDKWASLKDKVRSWAE